MNNARSVGAWNSIINLPDNRRTTKPRTTGITMVIDKGLGLGATKDLLETASEYIDFIKIAFGSSVLYSSQLLKEKIALIKSYGIEVYPGGTLFEIAANQNVTTPFYQRARELGFTYIEISEGTIDLSAKLRSQYIKQSIEEGFGVVSEVGKKDTSVAIDPNYTVEQIAQDLADGSEKVIIEGRDSGKGVGIYDSGGDVKNNLLDSMLKGVKDPNKLIIEAPQANQQNFLLVKLGPNVNFGNVQTYDVLTLESTRVGLRGDTLRNCLKSN